MNLPDPKKPKIKKDLEEYNWAKYENKSYGETNKNLIGNWQN
ncbi:MAG: hypothetical protein MRERC_3c017 [Mycoplasmataceae bacterium RC_NB112A]|nr:MAG: hypothetical protein MRERC_3c017 [Mycoplasmataceae bacterium RC_NB112A]